MTIAEVREKCKDALNVFPRDVLILSIIFSASCMSFGLGYLAGRDENPTVSTEIGQGSDLPVGAVSETLPAGPGEIVASKNGTKYYLPSCSGADRISEANKIRFSSVAAATAAGYTPAASCE